MSDKPEISIREFAKTIKVNESAVRSAIKESRFNIGWNAVTKKINPTAAAKDPWVIDQKIIRPKRGVGIKKTIEKLDGQQGQPIEGADMQSTLREKERISLRLLQIKLEETEGKLVRKDKVNKVLFAYASAFKDTLMAMPQRIMDDMLAAPNKVEAMAIMQNELTRILTEYASGKEIDFS